MPLLNRTTIAPLTIKSLSLGILLPSVAYQCLAAIWPLSVAKLGLDKLYDVLVAVISRGDAADKHCVTLITKVLDSFRNAFGNASNRKKVSYIARFEKL